MSACKHPGQKCTHGQNTPDKRGRRSFRYPVACRFFRRLEVAPNGCWLWTGTTAAHGYGHININGKLRYAHRLAYELMVGPIPGGLPLDHLCHTKDAACPGGALDCQHRRCANPEHLEPVTAGENARRGGKSRWTECPRGHQFDAENTIYEVRRNGVTQRKCRACRDRRNAEGAAKRKAYRMTSRRYLLAGQEVELVCKFVLPSKRNPLPPAPVWLTWVTPPPGAPRNAAVRYPDGRVVVRSFRGLRRLA
jgi:hypothetical protein